MPAKRSKFQSASELVARLFPNRRREYNSIKRLVKGLREDYDFDHHRPTVMVSRGDYERLLKFAEKCLWLLERK